MLAVLKSEFRKLLTIRSTYFVTLGTLLLTALLNFIAAQQQGSSIMTPLYMHDTAIFLGIDLFATFAAIIAILHVAHEYRYNTITYTLTTVNRRLKVFLSKTTVVVAYSLLVGALVVLVSYWAAKWGFAVKNVTVVSQHLDLWPLIWQSAAYILGNSLIALLLAMLIRSLVGAIVAYFFLPVIEQLLTLLMHDNVKYLPFNTLNQVGVTSSTAPGVKEALSPLHALGLFAIYLVVLYVVTLVLFIKRDAN